MSDSARDHTNPTLVINLFGTFQVLLDDRPLNLHLGNADRLLALLILRRDCAPDLERAQLALSLWPHHKNKPNTLVKTLKKLEAALGPEARRVQRSHTHIRFDVSGAAVDVVDFEQAIERGDPGSLKHAVTLYEARQGGAGLLSNVPTDGTDGNWLLEERAARAADYRRALATLAESTQDLSESTGYLRKLVDADRSRQRAWRNLIRILEKSGDIRAADRACNELQTFVPSLEPKTRKLIQHIRDRRRRELTPPRFTTSRFPPPHNIEEPTVDLIGREKETRAVKQRLAFNHLVTLTGTGGVGKTQLALQVARELREDYRDGTWFVNLAALTDPKSVPREVASVLNVEEEAKRPLTETLADHLKTRDLLLVLDNCEHLVGECARFAETLLRSCPDVSILTTTREVLGIEGEVVWRVPPLALPRLDPLAPAKEFLQSDAVRLFVNRASSASHPFVVGDQNALTVARVCHALDGIPLAIVLAAARVRTMTLEEMVVRLYDRFHLLTGGSRTALPRQQTLRATIDWSYKLLNEAEQTLLCRLSVFAGGWDLKAAEAIVIGDGIKKEQVLDLLAFLVDKSLVVFEDADAEPGEVGRYRLLETIREYTNSRLREGGNSDVYYKRHLDHFLQFAEEINKRNELRGRGVKQALKHLEAEHANFRSALQWCASHKEESEHGLRLVASLWYFWLMSGRVSEGRELLEVAINQRTGDMDTKERGIALYGVGTLATQQGDYAAAASFLEQGLSLWQCIGDKKGEVTFLNNQGDIFRLQRRRTEADSCYEQARMLCIEFEDKVLLADVLNNQGVLEMENQDYAKVEHLFNESLELRKERGMDDFAMAFTLNNLGCIRFHQGNHAAARDSFEESLRIRQELEDTRGIGVVHHNLGETAQAQGDYAEAQEHYKKALAIRHSLGLKKGIASTLESIASLSVAREQPERAAKIWGAAEVLRQGLGTPMDPESQDKYERAMASARAMIGDEAFTQAWSAGRSIHGWEQMVTEMLTED